MVTLPSQYTFEFESTNFYLFLQDIVHRDLKLENILLKEFDREKETYFVKVINDLQDSNCFIYIMGV